MWIGLVEVCPLPGNDHLGDSAGAYVHVFAPATDRFEYEAAARDLMAELDYDVLEIDDVEPFAERVARQPQFAPLVEIAEEVERSQRPAADEEWFTFPDTAKAQLNIARDYGVEPLVPEAEQHLDIGEGVRDGEQPVNGLRVEPEDDADSGWYIWAGNRMEPSEPESLVTLHVGELGDWCEDAVSYLALPPGWRFRIAPGLEEVWFDPSLVAPDRGP